MSWFSLRVEPGVHRDAVIAALFDAGAQGVQEDGPQVATCFPSAAEAHAALVAVRAVEPDAAGQIDIVPDTDWTLAWRANVRAVSTGQLTIAPPWLAAGLDPARTVVIDPGMAFGTGDHESTRGALRLMQQAIRPGLVVADLGAGSAVLSVAAARLGASRVFAIELDADALPNAGENVERNGVADVVHLFEGDAAVLLPLVAPVDVIVANIISSVLVELLPSLESALPAGGSAILAGMLVTERDDVLAAVAGGAWDVVAEDLEGEWWSVLIARR